MESLVGEFRSLVGEFRSLVGELWTEAELVANSGYENNIMP